MAEESYLSIRNAFADRPVLTAALAVAVSYTAIHTLNGLSVICRKLGLIGYNAPPKQKPCHVNANQKLAEHSAEFDKKVN